MQILLSKLFPFTSRSC